MTTLLEQMMQEQEQGKKTTAPAKPSLLDTMMQEQSARIPTYAGKDSSYWGDLIPWDDPKANRADFGTMIKASLVDDPQTKLNIMAKDMFPNDPNAVERFGFFDDEPYYIKGNQKVYATDQGIYGGTKQFASDVLGKFPTEIGATTGAVLGTAFGPGGTIAGAALGAAGGEGYRKVLGNLLFDEPQTPMGNVVDMTTESGLAGTGAATGELAKKVINRNVARDISRLDTNQVDDITRKAADKRIYLTPAETTNLPSLKAQQRMIGQMDETADTMGDMYSRRAVEVDDAVNRELNNISGIASPEDAGRRARNAATGVYEDIKTARNAAARPAYDAAKQGQPYDISPIFTDIDDVLRTQPRGAPLRTKANKIIRMLTRETDEGELVPVTDFDTLQSSKEIIDDMISTAKKPKLKGKLIEIKNKLLGVMDDQSPLVDLPDGTQVPAYRLARQIWKEGADEIDRMDGELVQILVNVKDRDLQQKAITLLNPRSRSPESILRLRLMMEKKDPQAWGGIVRSFIEDRWFHAGKQFATSGENWNRGAKFSAALFGDTRTRNILRAALTPQQYKSFEDLAQVLNATGRVKYMGSDTVQNMAMRKDFKEKSKGVIAGTVKAITSPFDTFTDWLVNSRMDKRARQIADIITDPNSRATLQELKKMDPGSEKFISGLFTLFGSSSTVSFNPLDEQDVTPPVLRQLNE